MKIGYAKISWGLIFVISGLIASCSSTASEVEELNPTDRLLIEVGPHEGAESTFTMSITTEQSYGCGAFLTRKLNRTKSGVAIQILGVVRGEPGCQRTGAKPLEEEITLRHESSINFEIRHRREMDRYRMDLEGNGWKVERIYNDLGTKLTAAMP